MAGDEIVPHPGTQPHRAQRCHGGNKPVNDHRPPGRRRSQKRAAHGGKVKATHLGKHVHRVVPVGTVHFDCLTDDCFLPQEALVGHAAAPAGDGLHLRRKQHRQNGGGRSGVADAHFPHAEGIGVGLGGELGTGEDGRDRLLPGHGGAARNILRAVGNFPVQHRFLFDIGIDAHIADGDAAAEMFRKNACAGFSTGQVHRLHQRHGLGCAGHALRHHAVVGGKYQKVGPPHLIMHPPGDARQLDGQVFQPPQTSGGLCKLRLTLPRLFHSGVIQRGNGGKQFVQFFFHVHPSKIRSSSIQLTAGAA